MSAPQNPFLQSVIGREYGAEHYCWSVLDDLFAIWPHVMAAVAILLTILNTYLMGPPAYLTGSICALALQLLLRYVLYRAYVQRGPNASLDRWLANFWLAAASSGFLWGLCLSLLLVDASPEARVTILTVGCVMIQSASSRAYMAPLPALSQSALMLSMLLGMTVAQGDYLMVPIAAMFVLFQLAYLRRLISLRLGQMEADLERTQLLGQLERTNTELRNANERLARHALTDGLTGLPNRRHLDRSFAELLANANGSGLPFSIVLIDVDHFKRFNDTYGHLAGDACLTAVGKAMIESGVRATDVIARYGGEEFALLLPNTDARTARLVAERMRILIGTINLSELPGKPAAITASLGIASKKHDEVATEEGLLSLADAALYAAKAEGRDRVRHADDVVLQDRTGRRRA